MGSVLAAVAAIAAVFSHATATVAKPQTVYRQTGPIAAFAQDGPLLAWFAPRTRGCNVVYLRQLDNGVTFPLPSQKADNVTCRFPRSGSEAVGLAVAADLGPFALWTLPQTSPLPLDYLLGAGTKLRDQPERRFLEVAHTTRGVGQWLGGISGDGDTLVYGVTSVDFKDEAGCLAGTVPCTLVTSGGGVYRVEGRQAVPVPGSGAAVAVAASANAVAWVAAGRIASDGEPMPIAGLPIQIVDAASGQQISSIAPAGAPVAIALAPHVLATLEQTPIGLRLAWYDRDTGRVQGSIPVPKTTALHLTTSDRLIVFRVGRSLRSVSTTTHRTQVLATAAATPIGLSLEGSRLAWAENLGRTARIRALYVRGRG
jgi:hypothetical protein